MTGQQAQTEFYSPFAHIEGRYEVCRIHSPSHGTFDTFIVVETTTDQPVTVYVNSPDGERFMKDRYPRCGCVRVGAGDLAIESSADDSLVRGTLRSDVGPVRRAEVEFRTTGSPRPVEVGYGGPDFTVWGSDWSCTGVDLNVPALVTATITLENETVEIRDTPDALSGIIALGSYGTLRGRGPSIP